MSERTLPDTQLALLDGRLISSAGDWLCTTALGWAIVCELGGGSETYAASRALSALGVTLFASATGPLLQRLSGVSVLVSACVVACILSSVTAAFVWMAQPVTAGAINHQVIAWMLFASFIGGGVLAYRDASEQRIQALLVAPEQQNLLEHAWTKLYYIGRITFGLISGVVLAAFGCAPLFLLDGATFVALGVIVVLTSRLVPATLRVETTARLQRSMLRAAIAGIGYSFRNYAKALWTVHRRTDLRFLFMVLFVVEGIGFTAWNFLPAMISQELKAGGFAYGLVVCLSGVGGLIGIISRGWILERWPSAAAATFIGGALLAPLGLIGVSFSPDEWVMSACYAVALLGWSWFLPPIRVFCRLGPQGPLIVAVLSLTLLGFSRVSQVGIAVALGTGYGLPGSVCVRISASVALVTLCVMFLAFPKTLRTALSNMFAKHVPEDSDA